MFEHYIANEMYTTKRKTILCTLIFIARACV